jgi:hypothetical protein
VRDAPNPKQLNEAGDEMTIKTFIQVKEVPEYQNKRLIVSATTDRKYADENYTGGYFAVYTDTSHEVHAEALKCGYIDKLVNEQPVTITMTRQQIQVIIKALDTSTYTEIDYLGNDARTLLIGMFGRIPQPEHDDNITHMFNS